MSAKKNEAPIKRWTAKRRTALVLEILRGQTTIQDASSLKPARSNCASYSMLTALPCGANVSQSKKAKYLNPSKALS